jgi:hypothetical protein
MASGDELMLGRLTVAGIAHPLLIPETKVLPGTADIYTAYVGMKSLLGLHQAALSVGMNPTSPFALLCTPGSINFFNTNVTRHVGDFTSIGRTVVKGLEFRSIAASNSIKGKSTQILGKNVTVCGTKTTVTGATVQIAGNVSINGLNSASGARPTIWDAKKGFDIPHPTKGDHRLRYICVEGPSAEVYLRGKLKDNNVIELPEYWRNLVDVETIGVTLTPVGYYQELFVEKIEWGTRIKIKNNSGAAINCDYTVFAERKDTSKNIPEYEGLTPADYPGDNREYVINGKTYE